MKILILTSLSVLFLSACGGGGSSGNGVLTSNPPNGIPDSKTFPDTIVVNGTVGNFKGEYINKALAWSHKNADGSITNKTKAVRLSIEQRTNKIRVIVWDGVGSTGLQLADFSPGGSFFEIDPSTQKLSIKDYYSFKGLIGSNSFFMANEGETYPNGPDGGSRPYSTMLQIQKLSSDKMFLRLQAKNIYVSNFYAIEDIFEGEVTVDTF